MVNSPYPRVAGAALAAGLVSEAILIRLGQTYGSTAAERKMQLPGDEIVPHPTATTDHAITIDAPAESVWPWLAQMGWHRDGWYTARWVDKLLFAANWPSANRLIPGLQDVQVGDFIPDGPPETKCGLIVEQVEPNRALVLHSTSHLPASWRAKHAAELDWSWVFALRTLDGGTRTRYHFRSRWTTAPWWFTAGGWLGIVPADFIMSHDMLKGVKRRAEAPADEQRDRQARFGDAAPSWTRDRARTLPSGPC